MLPDGSTDRDPRGMRAAAAGCLVPDGHGQLPSEASEPAGFYGQDPSGRRPWMVAVSPVSFREAEPRDASERCSGRGSPAGSPEEPSQSRRSTSRSCRCPGQLPVRGGLLGISYLPRRRADGRPVCGPSRRGPGVGSWKDKGEAATPGGKATDRGQGPCGHGGQQGPLASVAAK